MSFLSTIRNTFISKVGIILINFLLVVVSTNLWGTEGRGTIAILIADVSIITIINNILAGSCVAFFTPKRGFSSIMPIAYLWTLVSTAIFSSAFSFLMKHGSFQYIFLIALLNSLSTLHLLYFSAKQQFKLYNILGFLQQLINIILVFVLYYLLPVKTEVVYFKAYTLALFIVYCISATISMKQNRPSLSIDLGLAKEMFAYGWLTELSSLIQFVNYRVAYFLILYFAGISDVGIYSTAIAIAESIWVVSNSISTVLYSKVINAASGDECIHYTKVSARHGVWFSVLLYLVLLLMPVSLYSFIFGKAFDAIKPVIFLICPGILAMSLNVVYGHYFSAIGNTKILLKKTLVGIVFTVVLAPLLLKIYGMKGAAVATSISYLASTIYLAFYFYKNIAFKLTDFKVDFKEIKAFFHLNG